MTRRLIIEPEAEADLNDAFAWYEHQRHGLGDQFLKSVETVLAAIRRRPESFKTVHKGLRRAIVRRFPYGVFFILNDASVNVLAVLHAKRSPVVWKRRSRRS